MVGTAKKKENSAAAVRDNFWAIPPTILAPLRDTPGIMAKHWKNMSNNLVLSQILMLTETILVVWQFGCFLYGCLVQSWAHRIMGTTGWQWAVCCWLAGWQRCGWLAVGEPSGHFTEILVPESWKSWKSWQFLRKTIVFTANLCFLFNFSNFSGRTKVGKVDHFC
mgnify:CR=1 FL=1